VALYTHVLKCGRGGCLCLLGMSNLAQTNVTWSWKESMNHGEHLERLADFTFLS
jgi:hypothetical protein